MIPSSPPLYKDIRLYTFLGIIAFLLIHHFYGYFGHYGFDDILGYGYYGKKWADGNLFFLDEGFFSYRWGIISLTGLFYALFGMSDEVSAIAPSLVLLATVLLIFHALKRQEAIVGVIGVLIYAFDNWTMYYSDKLMCDTTVALATFAAFLMIYHHRFENSNKIVFHAFLLSVALILAYMSKESVLLLFPAFLTLMIIDLYQKRHQKFWGYVVVFCILMGILYLALIYILTGNPLMRFLLIEGSIDDNLGTGRSFAFCNYAVQSWSVLLYRIGFEMIYKSMVSGMMICLMLSLPAILNHRFRALISNKNPETYWALVLVLSALSSNFMTTSYRNYMPICPDIRHFLFLVPMAAVVAAPALYTFAQKKTHRKFYIIVSIIVFAMAKYTGVGNMEWVFAGILGLVLLRSFLPDYRYISAGFLFGIFLAALAPIVSSMRAASQTSYLEQRAVIYKYLKDKPHPSIVITNAVQRNFGKYYMEFDSAAATLFYDYSEIPKLHFSSDTSVYVLTNGMTRYLSNLDYEALPRCIKDCYEGKKPTSIEIIYETKDVALYKLHDPELVRIF